MPDKYHSDKKRANLFEGGFSVDSNHLIAVSLSLLTVIVILCFGLWGYKMHLSDKINGTIVEINNLQDKRDFELEADFANLKEKIEDFKKISEVHVYPSNIFKILEELTIPQIKFVGFEADLLEAELTLKVESIDYNTLAKQIVVFEDDSRIEEVNLSGVKLSDSGKVNSDLNMKINLDFLYSE